MTAFREKIKTSFFCRNCGHQSTKWLGKCPSCGEWNQFAEEEVRSSEVATELRLNEPPVPIDAIQADEGERLRTGITEIDRVLGGGIVAGSAVLVGGDPGIGKSTLLLQVLETLARKGLKVLYISGEESGRQIKLRGKRVGASSNNLLIMIEISLENILQQIKSNNPAAVVVDSIQTIYSSALSSAPGSVGQVREAAEKLIIAAKRSGIPIFLIGHVTKDGSIAGPKVLEHMVDTVLYFEGDSGHAYRIIRSIKNRFGPANEIGVFEMRDSGLVEVANPSAFFLSERPKGVPGSVVVPSLEGSRPILVEVQALVSATSFGMPRRTAMGVDHNRVALLVAVLDKICGLNLSSHDIYINVAGGVRVDEPAIDLGIASSVSSSFLDRAIDPHTAVFGEIGLTGEIRGIGRMEARIREAARMGFKTCIIPKTAMRLPKEPEIKIVQVSHLKGLLDELI